MQAPTNGLNHANQPQHQQQAPTNRIQPRPISATLSLLSKAVQQEYLALSDSSPASETINTQLINQ